MKDFGVGKILLALALLGSVSVQAEEAFDVEWVKQFGTSNYEQTYGSSTIDSNGNVFVTGSTLGVFDGQSSIGESSDGVYFSRNLDAYIQKYSGNGELLWTRQFGTSSADVAQSITTDGSGNVYITGYSAGAPSSSYYGNHDVFITKYSNDGVLQWTKYHGMTGYYDHGNDIAVDNSGNIFVTGNTRNGPYFRGSDEIFTSKSNSDGTLQWIKYLGVQGVGYSIANDNIGNIFITGSVYGTLNGEIDLTSNADAFIVKYSTDGIILWNRQFTFGTGTRGQSMAIDKSGSIFVTGYAFVSRYSGGPDVFITKHDSNGTLVWNKQFGSHGSYYGGDDKGLSITTDNSGSVLVTGITSATLNGETSSGGNDAFITKYSNSGSYLWDKQFGTAGDDSGYSVVSNSKGDIFVAGYTSGTFEGEVNRGGNDAFLAKFSSPNTAPVAVATATPQTVILNGTTVALNANQSYDPDADNISYKWGWIEKPLNSTAAFSNENSINPTFLADVKGIYTLYLDVTDTSDVTTRTEIVVVFNNIKPVADTGAYAPIVVGNSVNLDASASSDENGDTLTYSWSLVSKPAGSTTAIYNNQNVQAHLTADVEGTYEVSLIVNDGTVDSDPVNTTIEVITVQTATTNLIEEAIQELLAMPDSSFSNKNHRKTLINKLNVVVKMLASSEYQNAIFKLENDILPKADGQSLIYDLITKVIGYLQSDINQ